MNIKKVKELGDIKNSFLAEGLLVPNANKVNTNRLVMFCSHLAQIPVLANDDGGEPPLVFSRFENQIGKYSSGYKEAKRDIIVIDKFVRNKYNYILLVKDKNEEFYDYIERKENKWITEKYGYIYNNYIDQLEIGDEIEKGSILYANRSYDEHMNLCYGRNLRTMFYSDKDRTHEDAQTISKSAIEKLAYYSILRPTVNVNTNDILLNLYGDKDFYKCFPDIGEEIKEQQLLIRRRIVYDNMLIDLKDLQEYKQNDTVLYASGKVVDIHVYCNSDIEKLRHLPYYNQIVKYIDMEHDFYQNMLDGLEDILENHTEFCSNELIDKYNEAKISLDKNNYYEENNNKFDNISIHFTIVNKKGGYRGIKLAGRYGNKGVLSDIIDDDTDVVEIDGEEYIIRPDDKMPTIEDGPMKGLKVEMCLNPLGVPNRMNPAQLFEQEINFIGLWVRNELKTLRGNLKRQKLALLDFYNTLHCYEQVEFSKEMFKEFSNEELIDYFEELILKGIPVHQGPFTENIDIYILSDAYEHYEKKLGLEKFKLKGIANRMIVGEMYIMRWTQRLASFNGDVIDKLTCLYVWNVLRNWLSLR